MTAPPTPPDATVRSEEAGIVAAARAYVAALRAWDAPGGYTLTRRRALHRAQKALVQAVDAATREEGEE